MPLTNVAVDALGVVTISLVILLVLVGLLCIVYTLYFRCRIQRSGFIQLSYFNGPWILRISFGSIWIAKSCGKKNRMKNYYNMVSTKSYCNNFPPNFFPTTFRGPNGPFVLFGIWWSVGGIVRLGLFRQKGGFLHLLDEKWQEDICECHIVANLGFTEPCLFLTMSFLLRASLNWRGSGILSSRWNIRTVCYVLLFCLPVFALDLFFVLVGPKLYKENSEVLKLPPSFTRTTRILHTDGHSIAVCCYPLLCTILHGLFALILITYLILLGGRMLTSVINKGLRRRVYTLIFLISCFLPLRVILLGSSVFVTAHFLTEALAFAGFVMLSSCVAVGIYLLVYLPVADSLALSAGLWDSETGVRLPYIAISGEEHCNYNPVPLIPVYSQSLETYTDASLGHRSVSFRTMIGQCHQS